MGSNDSDSEGTSPFNRTAQHNAKRAAILAEAARLFNTRGARSTTLLDVANGLGLTKTSLYYYVKTKEDLIYQCYRASCELLLGSMQEIADGPGTGLEKIIKNIRRNFAFNHAVRTGQRPHTAALLEIASLKDDHRRDIETRYIALFKQIRAFIREGMEDGSIDFRCEPSATTIALLGAQDWLFNWLYMTSPDDIEQVTDSACDLVSHGLAAGGQWHEPIKLAAIQGPEAAAGFDRDQQNKLKQEAFYKAGTRFFNLKGFNGTSLDEIAETLHVTKGAFYYHIRNKEDLLYECYQRSLTVSGTILKEASVEEDGLSRVEHHCRQSFIAQNSDRGPLIRYSSVTALPLDRRRDILKQTKWGTDRIGEFIKQGIADGSVRAINALVVQEMISGIVNAALELDKWRELEDLQQASVDYFNLLINGLSPRA